MPEGSVGTRDDFAEVAVDRSDDEDVEEVVVVSAAGTIY